MSRRSSTTLRPRTPTRYVAGRIPPRSTSTADRGCTDRRRMRAFVVDAFTDAVFGGNPAGVGLLDAPADAGWMQRVAAEFRHAETAFVVPRTDGTYDLRWFTPLVEVDLCGHATL